MIQIETFSNRPIDENTYVVSDDTHEAIIIDCGALFPDDQQTIKTYIEDHGLTVKHHILTHGHFDHLFGAQWVADTYGCLPLLHAADADFYLNAVEMTRSFFHRPVPFSVPRIGGYIDEGTPISFGHHSLELIHTPGHTPGGCCLCCKEEKILLTGDSLFCGSIGRTDMPGGDHASLVHALRSKILTLPADITAYPGHGMETTIADELLGNPYL